MTLRDDMVYRDSFNYRLFAVSAVNLTNKLGINSKFSDPYGSGTTSVEYLDPRQVYGTISWKF